VPTQKVKDTYSVQIQKHCSTTRSEQSFKFFFTLARINSLSFRNDLKSFGCIALLKIHSFIFMLAFPVL